MAFLTRDNRTKARPWIIVWHAYLELLRYRVDIGRGASTLRPPTNDPGWILDRSSRPLAPGSLVDMEQTIAAFRRALPDDLTTGRLRADHVTDFLAAFKARRGEEQPSGDGERAKHRTPRSARTVNKGAREPPRLRSRAEERNARKKQPVLIPGPRDTNTLTLSRLL